MSTPWVTVDDLTGACAQEAVGNEDLFDAKLAFASTILDYWTQGRFGVREVTYTPVPRCLVCVTLCGDDESTEHIIPYLPIASVDSVVLDGEELTEGVDYEVQGRRLVKLTGSWPVDRSCSCSVCDGRAVLDTDTMTIVTVGPWSTASALDADTPWEVSVTYGTAPNAAAKEAAIMLGCELAKDALGRPCNVSARVRGAASARGFDPRDLIDPLDKARTGIPMVDAWLLAMSPVGYVGPTLRVVVP